MTDALRMAGAVGGVAVIVTAAPRGERAGPPHTLMCDGPTRRDGSVPGESAGDPAGLSPVFAVHALIRGER